MSVKLNIAEITPKIMEFFEKNVNTTDVDIDEVCKELSIYDVIGWDEVFVSRVKAVWLEQWLCTDTWVGTQAILFDGKIIGFYSKNARKSDANFSWIDTASVEGLTAFALERVRANRQGPEELVGVPPTEVEMFGEHWSSGSHYKCFV